MEIRVFQSLDELSLDQWENLAGKNHPFTRYEFLSALEKCGCLGERLGWITAHFVLFDDSGEPAGILPSYVKTNSYGELVFDWAWADAYQRSGLEYYPKLVTAIPYTPATGPRFLVHDDEKVDEHKRALLEAAIQFTQQNQFSSYHLLFPEEADLAIATERGLMSREARQFHWFNKSYVCFDDFLATMVSRKRKGIKRERRKVREAGVEIDVLHGGELDNELWQQLYPFYRDTFLLKGGMPTLTQAFFEEVSRTMGEQVVVIAARQDREYVAAAIFFRSDTVLYGRHWGCNKQFDSLHFELCYYQGIDYAIAHGLQRFEPGAQGEYKVSRGFEPRTTWSAHWIENPGFCSAIGDFLEREKKYMKDYGDSLSEELPFRQGDDD